MNIPVEIRSILDLISFVAKLLSPSHSSIIIDAITAIEKDLGI